MKLKITYKKDYPTGKYRSFSSKSIDIKLNSKKFATIGEKSVHDRSDRKNWGIQICVTNDRASNCKWKWVFVKTRFDTPEEAKVFIESNIEKIYNSFPLWMMDFDKPFKEEVMRVRKKCTECGALKEMSDFMPSVEFQDKKTPECKSCIEEMQFGENNSKINNNQTSKTMATLKEKRAAEAAAKTAGTTAEAPKTVAPKTVAPKTEKPKVGDTTEEGLKVVGTRGRKKREDNRPVEQLDLATGTIVIAEYPTIAEAAAAVGTNYQYLYDGLGGWTKSVAKFKWRYKGEEIYIRPKKVKTPVEAEFVKPTSKVDVPVPGDLDYDEEIHGQKEVVDEEELESQDESVFENEEVTE